jgi:pimeloyl-ACP methyl ester carboxylesterase
VSSGVILLHGLGHHALAMAPMAWRLRNADYRTLALTYPSLTNDIEACAESLHREIARFADSLDGEIHFVCHSLGGLVARGYLDKHRPQRLGRVVMLAPPHGGSEVADFLQHNPLYRMVFGAAGQQLTTAAGFGTTLNGVDYPLGIIAGDRSMLPFSPISGAHDGKVSVASTRVAGMADHIVVGVTHTLMLLDPRVAEQAVHFLKEGTFRR